MKSKYGVLLAISSLPGNHGIGDFGKSAYDFVDFLKKNNYKYWQILPINPIGPGNSPYMSSCSEAIDPRYIDLDLLVKEKLLDNVPHCPVTNKVDYQKVWHFKKEYLKKAFERFDIVNSHKYLEFKKHNLWVYPYSFFIVNRENLGLGIWNTWSYATLHYYDDGKLDKVPLDYSKECEFYIFCQFLAYSQFRSLKKYVNKKGIKLIADCPFYVGIDSVDCWLNKEQFLMDNNYIPTLVGGCPPDAFSEDGQLWGNPIYDFEKMKKDNYRFLTSRISFLASSCDYLRLDHFRAWDTYCVIPAEDSNAKRGEWKLGPGKDFFKKLYSKYHRINLIAEDLGVLFDSVHELRNELELPGMYITEFYIFDDMSRFNDNQIVYPGTHDNETIVGWINSMSEETRQHLCNKLNSIDLYDALMKFTATIPSKMTIFSMQDLMSLDNSSRMNFPGTVGSPNWEWKLEDNSYINKIKFNPFVKA